MTKVIRFRDKSVIDSAARAATLDRELKPKLKELKNLKEFLKERVLAEGALSAIAGEHIIILSEVQEFPGTLITEDMVGTYIGARVAYITVKVS